MAFISQVKETIGSNASDAVLLIIDTAKDNKDIRGLSGLLSILTLIISASAVFSQLKTTIVSIFSDESACEVEKRKLQIDWNIVRYNPYSDIQGKESSDLTIQRNSEFLEKNIKGRVKVVSCVGFDVKASCGMFIE